MKKISLKTIVFSVVIAAIIFTISYAVVCPTIYVEESLGLQTDESGRLIYNSVRYIFVAAVGLISFLVTFFIDMFFKFSERLCEKLQKNYKLLIKHTVAFSLAVVSGLITEVVFRAIKGVDSIGSHFNMASAAAFCALYVFVAIIVTERKNFGKSPEKAVALMIFALGIFIILAQPFSHNSWDIDSHYPWAVQNSFFKTAFYTKADWGVDNVGSLMFITNGTDVAAKTLAESEAFKQNMNSISNVMIAAYPVDFSLAHLPSGIGIALARLFGANFQIKYYCGELANLLVYSTTCYFAIKKLKSGKMVASTIALFPTNIFMAANYSYDCWVIGFGLLGTAYFVSELQQPDKKTTTKDTLIMCASFMLASLPKLVYVILFALPLFMFKNYKDKKTRFNYYKILIIFFIATIILFAIRSLGVMGGTGDTRGGAVNPSEQLAHILGNPMGYVDMLLKFLREYLSVERMTGYVSSFAYLGTRNTVSVFIVLLLWTAFTDKEYSNTTIKGAVIPQAVSFLLLVGGSALIATSMYIAFTPVGHGAINGCQPRYITPLIAPILLTIGVPGLSVSKNKLVYNTVTLMILAVSVWTSIYLSIAKIMM